MRSSGGYNPSGKGLAILCEESDGPIVAMKPGPANPGDGLEDKTLASEGVLVCRNNQVEPVTMGR
ncbi:MAG: hypothetical protein ACE5IF_04630 [Candidatus Bathyarchaeia archaeon]